MVVPTSQKCLEDRLRSYIKHQHSICVQRRCLGVQPGNHRQIHTGDGGLNFPVVSSFFFLAFQHPFPTSLVTISHFHFSLRSYPYTLSAPVIQVLLFLPPSLQVYLELESNQLEAVNAYFRIYTGIRGERNTSFSRGCCSARMPSESSL